MLRRRTPLGVVLALLLGACAPVAPVRTPLPELSGQRAPAGFPVADYERAAAQGKPVYRVDAGRSLVVITVRRGGSLAQLGHDHVVASHTVQGYVAPGEGRADLYVALNDLTVDEPAPRAAAALDTQPSESDIAGTRNNMLQKVLETERFPYALIHVGGVEKAATGVSLKVGLTLHGREQSFVVPTQLDEGTGELSVNGSFGFDQSQFGIVPYSILGGAVRVEDRVSLRFAIRADRQPD